MQQIQLTQGMIAVVDDDDFERFSHFRWFYRGESNGSPAMPSGTARKRMRPRPSTCTAKSWASAARA